MRAVAIFVCLLLGACSTEVAPPLVASQIVIYEPVPGGHMSAGYVSLRNNTDAPISISKIVSPEFESVEIHESLLENGIAKMRRIDELSIPAHSSLILERGGKHLMLMHPDDDLESVSLHFYSGDAMLLNVNTPITRAAR